MKQTKLYLLLLLIFSWACKKEITSPQLRNEQLEATKTFLSRTMLSVDYAALDFRRTVINCYDSGYSTVKIYFTGSDELVAVRFRYEQPLNGKIILLQRIDTATAFNGTIQVASLDRAEQWMSKVERGFVRTLHPLSAPSVITNTIHPPPPTYEEMEEVVIVAQYHSSGGVDFSTYINILALLENGTLGNWYEYFSGGGGGGGSNSGGNGGTGSGGSSGGNSNGGGGPPNTDEEDEVEYNEPIVIDYENQYAEDPIDILKYLKCFTDVPDAGATASIEIFTDIPVNGDPHKFFDFQTGSPGHTFIQLSKSNGNQLVVQNIGFYPLTHWKAALTTAPVDAKFVNNANHETNASYKVDITPQQLQDAILKIIQIRNMQYDIDDNNCTDFALNVFNAAVTTSEELHIPMYNIPGGMAPYGTSTPQGVFQKLEQIKALGGPAADRITIPLIGWVGSSHGPCN